MKVDVAIVGGGPAGLNAALVLGRARKRVALIDNGQPRNGVTHASHGFITRDGVTPAEFRRVAYEEVLKYPSVEHWPVTVAAIERTDDGFTLRTSAGHAIEANKIILSAGLKEVLPEIAGLRELYGKSIFNCPFCDGWELRDQPLVVLSDHPNVLHKVKLLYNWSKDLIVCTNGSGVITDKQLEQLRAKNIRVIDQPVAALSGQNGMLEQVHFADGTSIRRSGGFIDPYQIPNGRFEEPLGYEISPNGGIVTDEFGRTTAKGVYAAGDSAYVMPSQLIYAAASGSKAAVAVMADSMNEEWPEG
ncbi:NAD(P)/FAD-dependent oxidoreductase [Cohnella sp. GCM10027633]|uniref:NAD(P)/FAD-dependent oxidoreductase n=1 Tax=unclassified Cohnella TaxID=2636738 RepID=UPI00363A3D0D